LKLTLCGKRQPSKQKISSIGQDRGEGLREKRSELNHLEKRLRQKEESIERKFDQIDKREHELGKREKDFGSRERALQEKENKYNTLINEQTQILERISGITTEEAKQEILRRTEENAKYEIARLIKRIEDEAKENAEKKAKEIIGGSIQRYASDYVADATVSAVNLPSDDMKGRIIGREGRNIRALEAATGVDLIVDDTPEMVTLAPTAPLVGEKPVIAGGTAFTAAPASATPAPQRDVLHPPPLRKGFAVLCRICSTCEGVRLGLSENIKETIPLTCGAAILVP
jgi:ribonuclease Y